MHEICISFFLNDETFFFFKNFIVLPQICSHDLERGHHDPCVCLRALQNHDLGLLESAVVKVAGASGLRSEAHFGPTDRNYSTSRPHPKVQYLQRRLHHWTDPWKDAIEGYRHKKLQYSNRAAEDDVMWVQW